jgi:3'-5' exoribonuclease
MCARLRRDWHCGLSTGEERREEVSAATTESIGKTVFIDSLAPNGSPVTTFFLVSSCEVKSTKGGAPYIAAVLKDRTGEIDARMWNSADLKQSNTFVKVEGLVEKFNEDIQLKLTRWRTAQPDEIRLEDFIRASTRDRDAMISEILRRIEQLDDEKLRSVTGEVVSAHLEALRDAPAAKVNHQPYLGGLSEHILALCRLVDAVSNCYPGLNRDLLMAAAILHDIGKVKELEYALAINYTRRGSLVGHVGIGLQMVRVAIIEHFGDATEPIFDELEHIIASHHGRSEWGALVEPMSKEAMVFHCLDLIESRVAGFDEAKQTGVFYLGQRRVYVPDTASGGAV